VSTLKPVSRVTLGEQVAAQLSDQIFQGMWKPGEKLPSESELCVALNIGRSTLREALKSLAFVGKVQMRPGEGTYVVERTNILLEHVLTHGPLKTEKELDDVGEARLILETETVALAARRAESKDLVQLDAILNEMKLSLNGEGPLFAELDFEFHMVIAKSSKNQMLYELLIPIRDVLQEWIRKAQTLPEHRQSSQRQHAKILVALHQRDPAKAREAMRRHLQTCEKVFSSFGKRSLQPSLAQPADT